MPAFTAGCHGSPGEHGFERRDFDQVSFDISRYTILIADDDAIGLAVASDILHEQDIDVVAVTSGDAAWRELVAAPGRYDAIVLDRTMPGLSGLAVLEKVKAGAETRDIPVILLSGHSADEDIIAGFRAGAFHYVTKPYDPVLLVTMLRAAVEDFRSQVDLRQQLQAQSDVREQLQAMLEGIHFLEQAEFRFRTLSQARSLAALLAALTPDPQQTVTGLWELMLNAVEHGNLGITYAEKSALLNSRQWHEEVDKRLAAVEYRDRYVTAGVHREGNLLRYRITDQGQGFEPAGFMDFDPQRATHAHGRGIAMARRLSFATVEYNASGTIVEAVVMVEPNPAAVPPQSTTVRRSARA